MAVQERSSESPRDAATPPINISEARRMVGLEATWEIEALNETIRDLCEDLGSGDIERTELMSLRLKVRGLTARIEQLNNVAMSVLDPDEETEALARRVYGVRRAREAADA